MCTNERKSYGLVIAVLFLLLSTNTLFAAGGHETTYAYNENTLPEISPIDLNDGESLTCVATTNIVGDVVRQVAGDLAEVQVLMRVGQNPHGWEPSPRDLVALENADILFVNGFSLEENLMESLEMQRNRLMIPVSAGIEALRISGNDEQDGHDEDDHEHAEVDPHTWFSPKSVLTWVENIEYSLSAADPQNAEGYEKNAANYSAQLEELDGEIRALFAPVPEAERKIVVDHAALGYFARDYGFTVLGSVIPSTNDQAEPSPSEIADLIRKVEEEHISAIFVGGTADRGLRNLVDAVAEEIDGEIEVSTLLTGSLAPAGQEGDTYLGFARYNARQIAAGLVRNRRR